MRDFRAFRIVFVTTYIIFYFAIVLDIMRLLNIGIFPGEWVTYMHLFSNSFYVIGLVFWILSNGKEYKQLNPIPPQWTYVWNFSFTQYTTFNKHTGFLYMERKARGHRVLYVILALAFFLFEYVPLFVFAGSEAFRADPNWLSMFLLDAFIEFLMFAVYIFLVLPNFIFIISVFDIIGVYWADPNGKGYIRRTL